MATVFAVFVALIGVVFTGCQVVIAREKLRQEWFDRRYAVYLAFQRLLLMGFGMPPPGYSKDDGQKLIEEAFLAKTQAAFLFPGRVYRSLESLFVEAFTAIKAAESMPIFMSTLLGQQQLEYWQRFEEMKAKLDFRFAPLRILFEPYLKPSMLISGKVGMKRRWSAKRSSGLS